MNCNATIRLHQEGSPIPFHLMACWYPAHHEGCHQCGGLTWVDTIPGAAPEVDGRAAELEAAIHDHRERVTFAHSEDLKAFPRPQDLRLWSLLPKDEQ